MSDDLQKMQHGHEMMKPGSPWKTQYDREVMMPCGPRKIYLGRLAPGKWQVFT